MGYHSKSTSGEMVETVVDDDSAGNEPGNAFIQLHSRLLALEGKEAAKSIGTQIGLVMAGLIAAVMAYLLIIFGLTAWLATGLEKLGDGGLAGFAGAGLIMGLLHLIVGGILVFIATKLPKQELFAFTKREIQKDLAWLKNKVVSKPKKS